MSFPSALGSFSLLTLLPKWVLRFSRRQLHKKYTSCMPILWKFPAQWLFISSNNHSLFNRRKKALILGRRSGTIQAAWLGIEPRASGYANQCSDRWAIMLQPPLHWIVLSSMSTNVSASLLGNCHVAVYCQQRPTPWVVMWCTDWTQINHFRRLILMVTNTSNNHSLFCNMALTQQWRADIGRRWGVDYSVQWRLRHDSSAVRALVRITRGPGFNSQLRCLNFFCFSVPMSVLSFDRCKKWFNWCICSPSGLAFSIMTFIS